MDKIKICFVIQCHIVTNALIYNLNKFAQDEDTYVVIHVDKKYDITEFNQYISERITLSERRINVSWGSVSQIIVALNLFKDIEKIDFEYVSFISADDLFFRTLNEFRSFLFKNKGKEFIGVQYECDINTRVDFKYKKCFFERTGVINKLKRRFYKRMFYFGFYKNKKEKPFPRLYKGSNWFTISKSFLLYIINIIEKKPNMLSYFEDSFCCDEVFFQSIIMNSNFKNKRYISNVIDDNNTSLRYIDWKSGPDFPKILDSFDLDSIFEENIFFLRKIDKNISVDYLRRKFL